VQLTTKTPFTNINNQTIVCTAHAENLNQHSFVFSGTRLNSNPTNVKVKPFLKRKLVFTHFIIAKFLTLECTRYDDDYFKIFSLKTFSNSFDLS
jgi:hypothetical protein